MVAMRSVRSRTSLDYIWMGMLLLSCLVLPYLVKNAVDYKMAARVVMHQLADNQRQVSQESGAREQLVRWQSASAQWGALSARADGLGWLTSLWSVRSIEVDSKRFSRRDADMLISSLESTPNSFMLPREFSIKVVGDNSSSLLVASSAQDRPGSVQLSLTGDYYSRRRQ